MSRWWIILMLVVSLPAIPARAQPSAEETRAFDAALKFFQDEFWGQAEQEWRDFTIRFPQSDRLAEAVLYQARALVELDNHAGAVQLLQENLGQAGGLAPEYLFWIAEARFRAGQYTAAAQAFEQVVMQYPNSPRALEAVLGQAASRGRQKQWAQVIAILQNPDGVFHKTLPTPLNQDLLARLQLLLSEAFLAVQDYASAQTALADSRLESLNASLQWQKQFLLARTLLALERLPDALTASSNLVSLATSGDQPNLVAEARLFQGQVLEQMGLVDQSITAYRQNLLSTNFPPAAQRQTLMRLADLLITHNRLAEARTAIEQFMALNPDSATTDLARVTIAELKLRQQMEVTRAATNAPAATATNLIQQAIADLDALIQSSSIREIRGTAFLYRGWAEWMRNNYADSSAAFEQAAMLLPRSEDQATARFKWADSRFRLGDYEGAATNYEAVVTTAPAVGGAALNLIEPALYQILRAGLEMSNVELTTRTLDRLLKDYPNGFLASTAVLLTGQDWSDTGDPVAARRLFERYLQQSPGSSLAPEIRLAIARTYEAQGDWTSAIDQYEALLTTNTIPEITARAEYYRALDTAVSGNESNALAWFTNFVAVHATDTNLAPRAQWWIGDYYWRHDDYINAELNYQYVFQNWPQSLLSSEARMMAGRAAMARLSLNDARSYFTNLTSDLTCPPDLKARAMFAYGDTLMRLKSADTNDPLANYAEAVKVFRSIERDYPSNNLAARAQGMIGQCYLQFAVTDINQYSNATRVFRQVVDSPWADVASRSQAEVGLATVLEKVALTQTGETRTNSLQEALNHYLNVFYYEKSLRDGEEPDLFWIKKAGLEAGRLAEASQAWPQALKVYQRLQAMIPALKPLLENKILKAQEQVSRSNT